jgi:hypothetical protein
VSKKKDKGINSELEVAIAQLLRDVMSDSTATITDKVKVIDRSLKLEALKAKMSDDEWGSGFMNMDDDE